MKTTHSYLQVLPLLLFLHCWEATNAQSYLYNHKQTLSEVIGINDQQVIRTKAFTEVTGETKFTYAATFRPSSLKQGVQRPLLVKLKQNLPLSAPFAVEWAKTFIFPTEQNGTANNEFFDVNDVHYSALDKTYILCGRSITEGGGTPRAFMMTTDSDGNVLIVKRYPNIALLTSVVSKKEEGMGYMAVGSTQTDKNSGTSGALMLSVDSELVPVCAKDIRGSGTWNTSTNGGYSKIIQYGADFAMVGTMSDDQADESSNVLVTVADEACEITMNKHYGSGVEFEGGTQYRYNENGLSITAVGLNLFISGVTQKSIVGLCTDPIFRDILLFRLNRGGTVMFMKHYDHAGLSDVGFAITHRPEKPANPPIFTPIFNPLPSRPKSEIFIAGSTESEQFNKVPNDDVFLLTTDMYGDQKSFEIFGGGWDDGHVQANVDLAITHDRNALILANTMSFTNDPSAEVYSFLIERYDTITDQCEDKPVVADSYTYPFPGHDGSAGSIAVSYETENMVAVDVVINSDTLCEKKKVEKSATKKEDWEY